MWKRIFLVGIFLFNLSKAGEINIYLASDLVYAFEEIKKLYKEKYPDDRINVIYGSSGKGFTQIIKGAPYDLIFSANIDYVKKLKKSGFTVSEVDIYAIGKIVLWKRKDKKIDLSKGIYSVLEPDVKKIAVANWRHAPYGVAAKECMDYYRIYEKVKNKLVFGENISQTAQYTERGLADIGFIALSLAKGDRLKNKGNYILLPQKCYTPIKQGYAILKHAKKDKDRYETAKRFFSFIKTKEVKNILKKYGFSTD